MRIFLIRHGETVDNVANVYAGTRDSALTAHGATQAALLGAHLALHAPAARARILSSDLQRAARTAEAICDARGGSGAGVVVEHLAHLRERDLGSAEGLRFGDASASGHGRGDGETDESMRRRVDEFLDHHLLPLYGTCDAVFVVSHGLILNVLYRRLRHRVPSAFAAGTGPERHDHDAKYLPWRNTGYLEAVLTSTGPVSWSAMELRILRVNSLQHLQGLRKTRGGIGSARFDERQRTMDSFLVAKKRDLTDADS